MLLLISVGCATLVLSSYSSYRVFRRSMEESAYEQVLAIRELKTNQTARYFSNIREQARTFSQDLMVIEAMSGFREAFAQIDVASTEKEATLARLATYYNDEFMSRLEPHLVGNVNLSAYWPTDKRTQLLQDRYIADNPHSTGAKHLLESGGTNDQYDRLHELYHPVIRSYLESFGYYDIFLIDPVTGHIVYSVFKEVDYATSLLTGPYRDTNFAQIYRVAREADEDAVRLVDFASYPPSYNAPASFIAAPIHHEGETIGVLVFQMPVDRINDILSSSERWSDVGMGRTGEAYIVGSDHRLRTESRFFVEQPEAYLEALEADGTAPAILNAIRRKQTTIGLQTVKSTGATQALAGLSGTTTFEDYRGVPVLSAYAPLPVEDVHWAILSEIDASEALEGIDDLRNNVFMGAIVIVIGVGLVSVLFSQSLTRPLKGLAQNARRLAEGDRDTPIVNDNEDEIGELAASFESMRQSVQQLVGELEITNQRQANAIEALSTPLIPLQDGIVVMALVGDIDEERLSKIQATVLAGLDENVVRVIIIDITGVPALPAVIANGFETMARTVDMLGVRTILTGIAPAVAGELSHQAIAMPSVHSARSLQQGVGMANSMLS